MKVSCIDNLGVEYLLTQGKVYEATNSELDCNYFVVTDDSMCANLYFKERFKVIPSIDDVIKDKEREKRTMNGLEAIKVMMEGKLVSRNYAFSTEKELYKIIDGNVHVKLEEWDEEAYQIAEEFDFDETYYEYIEPKPLIGWERVNEGEEVYFISVYEGVEKETDYCDEIDDDCYEIANYFSTKEKAEEINFKQTLFRKLQRFSDENGGNEIDWEDHFSKKLYIAYRGGELFVDWMSETKYFGQVYFISREVAQQAIELFHDELIKYFTHDWSGRNE